MAAMVSGLCTIIVLVIFLGFKDHIGVTIRQEFQRQLVHFEVLLYETLGGFPWASMTRAADIFIAILALLVSFVIFCLVPVLIRFVNCWTEMREEVQKTEESIIDNMPLPGPIEPEPTRKICNLFLTILYIYIKVYISQFSSLYVQFFNFIWLINNANSFSQISTILIKIFYKICCSSRLHSSLCNSNR